MKRKIVVGITGASGAIYAHNLLQKIEQLSDIECALVFSSNAKDVWKHELDNSDFEKYQFITFDNHNFYAPFASGSSSFDTLIICPCSMGTLGRIANGTSDNLINRTADVMLKEKRKLICVVRETPFNLIHLNNMKLVHEAGGIICPASPSFYSKPKDINALVETVSDRILSLAQLAKPTYRWQENED